MPELLLQAIDPPISQVELQLEEKAHWFAAWISTDEGQQASPSLRAAAELLAQGQFQGAIQQQATVAAGKGTVSAAMQAPGAMGAAQLEAAQQQPESQEPDPSAVLQYRQEQSTQQHEAEQNALDRSHEMAMLDKEEQKDKTVSEAEADDKIRIEKAKPRPRP